MSKKIIDISITIEEGMTTYPTMWHPFVEITQLGRLGIEQRESRKLVMGTHTGTHIDAPRHFIEGGQTVESIPLDQLIGSAVVLNFSHLEKYHEITLGELKKALDGEEPERIIFRFDWSEYLQTPEYYVSHPFLSEAAARYLVEIGVKLIAMDSPMPDNPKDGKGTENDSPVHKILLGNNIIIVEYLTNLSSITRKQVDLVVAPLKIKDGDGSPARCFIIEE
jgi:arylformamidase